jgi:hypothetical protein
MAVYFYNGTQLYHLSSHTARLVCYDIKCMRNKKLSPKDKKLRNWLKQGGHEGAKKDFITLLKQAVLPSPR